MTYGNAFPTMVEWPVNSKEKFGLAVENTQTEVPS